MEIKLTQGIINEDNADTVIVNLLEGATRADGATGALDQALDGAIQELIDLGDISGKLGAVTVVYPRKAIAAKRIIVVGLGKLDDLNLEVLRKVAATAIKKAQDLSSEIVASIVHGAGIGGLEPADASQALVEGTLLGLYTYKAPKKIEIEPHKIKEFRIVEFDDAKLDPFGVGVKTARSISSGVYLARDLVNMPPNVATPTHLASEAREIADAYHMILTVGDRDWAARKDMGAFLAVGQGAEEEPKFIILEHNSDRKDLPTIVLVGKGITFDTGGISIKGREGLETMKSDMAGAAAVLGTMKAVGMLDLPLRVIGIAPCTENKPDGKAYLPSDVITASNGKTIEIISTDAEGRMVLADGLVYAKKYEPNAVVDLATLTGACVIALGKNVAAGIFGNDEVLRERLIKSGDKVHERLWPMPLYDDYRQTIDSKVADVKNSGGMYGGVGTSAIFLREFVDFNWAHIDMAGMALSDKGNEYTQPGATGFGVRLLVDFLRSW